MNFFIDKLKKEFRGPILKGALIGLINSTVAYSILLLGEIIQAYFSSGDSAYREHVNPIAAWIFFFMIGEIVISVPSMISGSLLAIRLYKQYENDNLSLRKVFFYGAMFGMITVWGFCALASLYIGSRGDVNIFLLHSVEVTILGFLAGGVGAVILARGMLRDIKP